MPAANPNPNPNIVAQLVLGPIQTASRNAREGRANRWVEVEDVIHSSTFDDGVAPFSEQFLRGMSEPELGHWHVVAKVDGVIRGVAAVDPSSASVEVAVHPAVRHLGVGHALGRAVRAHAAAVGLGQRDITNGTVGLTWWAHGDLPAARKASQAAGAVKVRELLVMDLPLAKLEQLVAELPDVLPESFRTEVLLADWVESAAMMDPSFVDESWLEVNNEAFDWHPEQGGWDRDTLNFARKASWFDPHGVLLAWDKASIDTDHPRLLGFHWTKLRRDGDRPDDLLVGEVYVIGLAAAARGKGWGRALTAAGIKYLADKGAKTVELYVEGDNTAAIAAYEALGFTVTERHTAWKVPPAAEV